MCPRRATPGSWRSDYGTDHREVRLVEGHRQRGERPLELLRGQRDNSGRVDATREKGAERHVAHQVMADRLLEERARGGHRLRAGWRPGLASRVHRVAEIPVAHRPETGGVDVSD